ncbi:MAG: SirB2 family protein [Gammaproteobacteria bacterium]|nr:SirB2 family protein [Gammaproteobacteria bacterium]MBU1777745.1 SirB2 family protein [Gammaproteobacteria bacterium]MBU1969706.1 SirB2 family protein [Gammaproteobacteria bacterium]
MNAELLKTIHVTSVALSYSLFCVRGVWMLRDSPLVQARWTRLARDSVDSMLLISAITLAWQLGISPLEHSWLAAKIGALLLYIVIGSVALKRGRTKPIRLAAWLAAQVVFLYIVGVAMTHSVMSWLS